MKHRTMGIIMMLAAAVLLMASCAPAGAGAQTTAAATTTIVPMASPTPAPTEAEPVTDIPPDFLPGISEAGILPTAAYSIGVIGCEAQCSVAGWAELETICAEYEDKFDIDISAELCTDAQQQTTAAKKMIADGADMLIIAPLQNGDLADVGVMCEEKSVPYITMGARIGAVPGQGSYICSIERDDYMTGVLSGISIVQAMTEKYGQPRGNIGELTGAVSDQTSILRSSGLRRVFVQHSDMRVVCSVTGEDDETYYAAAVNILKAYRAGELDGIVAVNDTAALQVLQAVLNYDRTELLGAIWTAGGTAEGLTGVWHKQFAQTVEYTGMTGMTALEYALQYLEGNVGDIPPVVTAVTRVFSAGTDEQSGGIAALIAQMKEMAAVRCLESIGGYDLFLPDAAMMDKYYPTSCFEMGEAYINELEPYTTEAAVNASDIPAEATVTPAETETAE